MTEEEIKAAFDRAKRYILDNRSGLRYEGAKEHLDFRCNCELGGSCPRSWHTISVPLTKRKARIFYGKDSGTRKGEVSVNVLPWLRTRLLAHAVDLGIEAQIEDSRSLRFTRIKTRPTDEEALARLLTMGIRKYIILH